MALLDSSTLYILVFLAALPGSHLTGTETQQGGGKGRALSGSAGGSKDNLTGQGYPGPLDDVSMDEETPGLCLHGERIERGCDQVCTCKEGRLVCVGRCAPPLVPTIPPPSDPACILNPTPDHCCATIVCSHGNDNGGCTYKNESYQYGEKFNDSCAAVCLCEENGEVSCKPRCPPSNRTVSADRCLSIQDTKDPCCTVLYCDVNANEDNGSQEDVLQLKIVSAVPANSSSVVLNFEKSEDIDKISAEVSFDKISWSSAKTQGHMVTDLSPGKTYFFRASMDGVQSNVVSTMLPDLNINSTTCEYKGKSYERGEEFHDGCTAYCSCGKSGVECATIECPTDFGLDVLDPTCLAWETQPADFTPTPPNCCPQSLTCKNNGSCIYHGERFDNWADIPDKLTGCEQKCYCETGNVTCRPRCPPVPAKPPSELVCPPNMAILSHPPDDNCCLHWMCPSHTGGDANATTNTNNEINSTQKPIEGESFIPFPGPLSPNKTQLIANAMKPKDHIFPGPYIFHASSDTEKPKFGKKPNISDMNGEMKPPLVGPFVIPLSPEHMQKFHENKSSMAKVDTNSTDGSKVIKNVTIVKEMDKNHEVTQNLNEDHFVEDLNIHSVPIIPTIPIGVANPANVSFKTNLTMKNLNSENFISKDKGKFNDDVHHNLQDETKFPNVYFGTNPLLYPHSPLQPSNKNTASGMYNVPHNQVPFNTAGQYPRPDIRPVESYNHPENNFNQFLFNGDKQIPSHGLYTHLQNIHLPNQNEPLPHDIYHIVHSPQKTSNDHRVPSQYLSPEELYLIESRDRLPTNPTQNEAIYQNIPNNPNLKKETIHIHSPTIPSGLRLEDIIEQIRHHEATDLQTKDAHVVLLGAQPPNLSKGVSPPHSLPGFTAQPHDPNGISVHTLEAVDENTVRLVFSVPPILVGLHGRVELRYTADKKNSDPSTWEQQVLAPPNDLIATSELEFELGGLQPNTEYKIKITVVMRGIRNSPASQILSVRTPGPAVSSTALPPVIPVEPELHVSQLNSTWATLVWRKFTDFELQFIDGVQLRFKELAGKVYQATPLIHRAVTSYTIEDLKPESRYEVGIFFIPFPGQVTELQAQNNIQISTTMENDPYRFELMLEVHHIKSSSVEVTWSGVPYPEDKYVNIFRILYQSEGGREDMNSFKVAKRDSPASTLIQGLKSETRYRLWLEAYLTNGRIKKSNVKDFTTKQGVTSANDTNQGKLEGTPLVEKADYYGSLVGVSILAAIAILTALGLLLLLAKKHGHNKAPITAAIHRKAAPHTAAYDNPSYKTCEGEIASNGSRTTTSLEETLNS